MIRTFGYNQKKQIKNTLRHETCSTRRRYSIPVFTSIQMSDTPQPESASEPVSTECYLMLRDPDPRHESSQSNSISDDDYFNPLALQQFNQEALTDLVRDFAISNLSSELLASRLDEKN